ncbi:MAG: Hvo_1808 family surface protein [Halobacteriales archaeon]
MLIILTAVLMITSVVAPAAGHSLSANTASTTVEEADTSGDGETSDTTSETVTPTEHDTDNSDRVNVTGSLGDGSSAGVKTVFARIHDTGGELPPEGPGGEGVARTLTDANGNFTLEVPANDIYDIFYYQGDFLATQNQTNLVPRDGIPDVFAIESVTVGESDVSLGDQAPPAGHDLNVSVVDESGNPVPGALVTYIHTENDPDDPARASLPGLPTNANGLADISRFNTTARGVAGLEVAGNVTVLVAPPGRDDQPVDPTQTRTLTVTEDDQITVTLNQTGTPRITNATAIDLEDGDGVVSEGDRVELRATVTDPDNDVVRVGALPDPFGVEQVELTSAGGDRYTGTFVVGSDFPAIGGSYPIQIVAEDGAGNFANVNTNALEVNASNEEPVGDGTPPTITNATAIDREDGDGVVSEGDRVELRVTVTDADGDLARVFAVPEPFGVEQVELTSAGGDRYTGTFVVGSEYSPGDGNFEIPIVAEDDAGNFADVETEPLEVNGSGERPVGDETPPTITGVTAVDRENDDGVVSNGDLVEIRATVTDDDSGVEQVFASPIAFGVGNVELTSAGDQVYNGTFRVDARDAEPDGSYSIGIFAEDEAGNGAEAESDTLELDTSGDRVNVTGSLEDGSSAGVKTVFAVVRETDGEFPSEGREVARTTTDANGNFTLGVLSNGTYDIVYRQGNFLATENLANLIPRDGIPDVFAIERVAVGESDVSLGDQAPPAGHDLNVSVVDESGNPVQGALVTYVHTENDPDDPARASLPGLPTNANGLADISRFNTTARGVAGLEVAGNVTVLVAPPGRDDQPVDPTQTRTLTVTEDDQITVTLNETSDTGDTSGPASSVRLTPASQTVGASGTTTFDVVVEDADGGVGAHTTEISIADPSVAGVTDIQLLGNPGQQTVDIAADNGSVTIDAALVDTADTGPVTIARITLQGNASGTTAVNLGVSALGNETGNDYQVTNVDGATLTVTAVQAIGNFDNAPTDPDGDGFHEDINGNGEVNVVDVQAMFVHRDDPAMTENPQLFDFSGNDEVDIVDVQALFAEITSPSPDPGDDQLGREGGYRYDDPVSVDRSDGLNQTELEAVVARSMARVEEVRQLEFEERVPVNVISREQFASDQTGREYTTQERLHQNTKWEALFAVNESTNALRTQESNRAATVLGFYNYARDEIVIVSENTSSPKMDEITLAQELFHALQDQKLRISYGRMTTEGNNAALGIIEGDGNLVDRFYKQRCEAEWDCLLPEASGGGGGSSDINYGIYLTQFQPYSDGPKFVRQIYNEDGWEAVNDVYENPPESTEQVIHPEKYPDEEPTDVSITDTSTEEWQVPDLGEGRVDHVAFGEAGLGAMMMRPVLASGGEDTPVVTARELYNLTPSGNISDFDPLNYGIEVTNGWDGDRLIPYANESSAETNETAYVWKINWDSEADATEFIEGYKQLLAYYGAETVDSRENTYRIPEGNGFADAFYVKQDGDTVTIVNAPTVDDLGDVHASAGN